MEPNDDKKIIGREVAWKTDPGVEKLKGDSLGFIATVTPGIGASATAMSFAGTLMIIVAFGGHTVPLAFLIATVLMVFSGLSFAELSKLYPSAGGFYAFMRQSTNIYGAWWATWVYYLVIPLGGSTIGGIFVLYMHAFTGWPYWILTTIVCAIAAIVNWRGIELATKIIMAFWIIQVLGTIIVGVMVFSWAATNEVEFALNLSRMWIPEANVGVAGIVMAAFACIYAYCGFENPTTLGEESKVAWRTVYWAVIIAPVITGVVCMILGILWMAAVPESLLPAIAASADPLNVILEHAGMPKLIPLITGIVVLATIGCLAGWWTGMTRIWYDKARAGSFPKKLSKLNKHKVPSVGMIVISFISWACIMVQMYGNLYDFFILLTSFGAIIMYASINIANIWAHRGKKGFGAWMKNRIIPGIAILGMLYLLSQQELPAVIAGIIWSIIGIVVIMIIHKVRGRKVFELEYEVTAEIIKGEEKKEQ